MRLPRMVTRSVAALSLLLSAAQYASAQYAVSGSAPADYRWRESKTAFGRVVYPSFMRKSASMVSGYIDSVAGSIRFGIGPVIRPLPVVLYPGNMRSNGLVAWAPKRMELLTSPPVDNYALTWLKQLSVHEYRHVVQISNLDVGFTRALSRVLGQQAVGIVTGIPPGYFFEGDATVAETEHAMFGRGRQPSFSMGYRALLDRVDRIDYDRFKLGSYKNYYPDQYELGYYIIQSGRRYYGFDAWDKIINYTGRHPFYIVTGILAYKKFTGEDSDRIAERTFTDLRDFWREASSEEDSTVPIATPRHSYTVYEHPAETERGEILALKRDMGTPRRFVAVNTSDGTEIPLRFAQTLSSRPVVKGDMVIWSEYKPSLFWEQKSYSVIRTARIDTLRGGLRMTSPRRTGDLGSRFLPVFIDSSRIAAIEYSTDNTPYLVIGDSLMKTTERWEIGPVGTSVSGLAWDGETATLAAVIVDESGMWIGGFDRQSGRFEHITPSSYVTVSELTAGGGRLYFSSIAHGKNELHTLDLRTGKEYRITSSRYGTLSGAAPAGDTMTVVTYGADGALLASQALDTALFHPVVHTAMPSSRLDPYPEDMGLPKLDTVSVTPSDEALPGERRFRRGAAMFNVHSWMPVVIDINRLMSEQSFDHIGVGANILMQDIIGSSVGSIGYGWDPFDRTSLLAASYAYTGLPVHLGIGVDYGGGKQLAYMSYADINALDRKAKDYLEITASASMPMDLSDGRNVRILTPSLTYNYNNGLLKTATGVSTGVHKLGYALSWSSYRYMTVKDLAPRLGYSLTVSGNSNPFNSGFGSLLGINVRGWLPGVARNHSLTLDGQFQTQRAARYNFMQRGYYPTGCDLPGAPRRMVSTGASYKFPIVYPDGGIRSLIYFKRIALDLFGQYARGKLITDSPDTRFDAYTYGAEILFTYNLLRFSADINTGISVYKPSTASKPAIGVSFSINL
ncbi:MAG: DUF2268 domain-containing protein [Rikenellaceae bacterium]|nr:DUF2268 domain-containing protein [Rikenellaceae bacterium]